MSGEGVMLVDKDLHKVDAEDCHQHGLDFDVTPTVYVKKGEPYSS